MIDQIREFLTFNVKLNVRTYRALMMIAEHFGGEVINGRYVKINGIEYSIWKEMDIKNIGWKVREMTWTHGNNWIYAKQY